MLEFIDPKFHIKHEPCKLEDLFRTILLFRATVDHFPDAVAFVGIPDHSSYLQLIDRNGRLESSPAIGIVSNARGWSALNGLKQLEMFASIISFVLAV